MLNMSLISCQTPKHLQQSLPLKTLSSSLDLLLVLTEFSEEDLELMLSSLPEFEDSDFSGFTNGILCGRHRAAAVEQSSSTVSL